MERNRLCFAFFDSQKPLKIQGFSEGGFQNGVSVSRPVGQDPTAGF